MYGWVRVIKDMYSSSAHRVTISTNGNQKEDKSSGRFRGVSKVLTEPPFWLDQVLNKY